VASARRRAVAGLGTRDYGFYCMYERLKFEESIGNEASGGSFLAVTCGNGHILSHRSCGAVIDHCDVV
jgi:hypothetical protein